jgi:uncharacterized protein
MKLAAAAALAAFATMAPRAASAADYAPIDCAKAQSPAQVTICRTYSLGQAEAHMATLFGVVMSLVAMGQRGDIGDAQVRWLKVRDACGVNVACLTDTYRARISVLDKAFANIAANGPY